MMIDRRTFIQSAAILATAPALEAFLSFSSTVKSHASLPPCTLPPQTAGDGTDMNPIVFKIDGWDRYDDHEMNRATKNPLTKISTANQVLIRINQSWRTAWR
jgi:hypothetical protein